MRPVFFIAMGILYVLSGIKYYRDGRSGTKRLNFQSSFLSATPSVEPMTKRERLLYLILGVGSIAIGAFVLLASIYRLWR